MKKKGFTLVELLAVIAILAIIALIALPTINSLIKETRKKAFIDTSYGIIKAGEQYYAKKDLLEDQVVQATFEFPNATSGLELSGKLPTSGSMKIDKIGNISLAISNGRYCVKKGINDTEVTLTEDIENCNIPNPHIISASNDCATKGKCTQEQIKTDTGVKVTVQVNDKETKDFYVIADNGTELTLIMSENLGETVEWASDVDYGCGAIGDLCSQNDKGPITAINYLDESTDEEWSNIPKRDYTYSGIGDGEETQVYDDITKTMRARMITYKEATDLNCTTSSCPSWLAGSSSYWTSTANASRSIRAWSVGSDGGLSAISVYASLNNGIRPVIELSK